MSVWFMCFSKFSVMESSKYPHDNIQIRITFAYNTKVKEVKGLTDKFQYYYF
jgi:hypothetical protein